jgi:hypothetical protein
MVSIYGFIPPMRDPYEIERQERVYKYLEGKIKVEISLNPYPTDEGYNKLLIEVAKSCCSQVQRMALIELLGMDEKNESDE